MKSLFNTTFKINKDFNSMSDFVDIMVEHFNITPNKACILYEVVFSYKKEFQYYDLDSFFLDDYHDFLANSMIVEVD